MRSFDFRPSPGSRLKNGRGKRIRTSGPCLPKTVLYQAELFPDRSGTAMKKQFRRGRGRSIVWGCARGKRHVGGISGSFSPQPDDGSKQAFVAEAETYSGR